MPYHSTLAKDIIRREFDKNQIEFEYSEKRRSLSYVGLPSEKLTDVIGWKQFLGSIIAIENAGAEIVHEMIINAITNDLIDILDILRGDLEDIILSGKDEDGKKINYPFDIANFDFLGGIVYKGFRRLNSIKKFIQNQVPNNFLLFQTFNIVDSGTVHRGKLLDGMEKEIHQMKLIKKGEIEKIFNWYRNPSTNEAHREKIFVNYFLKHCGETNGYDVFNLSPIKYEGAGGSIMIHFASRFRYGGSPLVKHFSKQSLLDIINMKLREVIEGKIVLCKTQAPKIS